MRTPWLVVVLIFCMSSSPAYTEMSYGLYKQLFKEDSNFNLYGKDLYWQGLLEGIMNAYSMISLRNPGDLNELVSGKDKLKLMCLPKSGISPVAFERITIGYIEELKLNLNSSFSIDELDVAHAGWRALIVRFPCPK